MLTLDGDLGHLTLLIWLKIVPHDNQTFLSKRNELMLGPWRMIIKKQDGLVQIQ
ncbi:unnamed protein product, partial [Didymodactylos carnosus]